MVHTPARSEKPFPSIGQSVNDLVRIDDDRRGNAGDSQMRRPHISLECCVSAPYYTCVIAATNITALLFSPSPRA